MTRALVIAPQWIGDAVMTEPLLRRLAARGERLTVGALPWVAPVYRAMPQVADTFRSDKAIAELEAGKIVVFGGGTGNPIFSTDTASALRALEIGADAMFKATMVDGVYDKDPHKYPDAVKYDTLTFTRVLDERLAVMDSTAATLCRDNGLPIVVFDLNEPANIARALQGENVGTIVRE